MFTSVHYENYVVVATVNSFFKTVSATTAHIYADFSVQ